MVDDPKSSEFVNLSNIENFTTCRMRTLTEVRNISHFAHLRRYLQNVIMQERWQDRRYIVQYPKCS